MKSDNSLEILPVVDESGNVIASATRGECHSGSKLLHPVVHVHVFDSIGRLYLQKRPLWKDIQPGKWDTAVGGHVDYGETVDDASVREAREELSIDVTGRLRPLGRYVFESAVEKELINSFTCVVDPREVRPTEELDSGQFWTRDEIEAHLNDGTFTPNFTDEYLRFFA